MSEQETRDELNRLYWETDESVADIADRLDISRRALYDGIEPRPAGAPCPDCAADLGFRNRTAEEHGEAECPECGRELELPADATPAPAEDEAFEDPTEEQERTAAGLAPTRRVPPAGGGALLGFMLLIGLGIGALVAFLLRRR